MHFFLLLLLMLLLLKDILYSSFFVHSVFFGDLKQQQLHTGCYTYSTWTQKKYVLASMVVAVVVNIVVEVAHRRSNQQHSDDSHRRPTLPFNINIRTQKWNKIKPNIRPISPVLYSSHLALIGTEFGLNLTHKHIYKIGVVAGTHQQYTHITDTLTHTPTHTYHDHRTFYALL